MKNRYTRVSNVWLSSSKTKQEAEDKQSKINRLLNATLRAKKIQDKIIQSDW